MRFTYDPEVDILMVYLDDVKARRSHGERLPFGGCYADLAADGTILALEILDASAKYPADVLAQYPADYHEPISVADAARLLSMSYEGVKKAIQRGRLEGRKIGRNWTTTIAAVNAYGNSRAIRRVEGQAPEPESATPRRVNLGQAGDQVPRKVAIAEQAAPAVKARAPKP